MFIFITPISNVITFLVNNSFDQTNSINDILYPTRGWPKKDRNQLNVWQFLYQDAIDKVGKPGYDEIGIPTADINDYINNKIIHSQSMQIYMALTLRTYFIEFTINKINDPSSNYINANEYLNLWVMKYFEAGFYFQWVKIWIQDLGRTIEKSIDIDFYTFDKYVERNNKGEYMWNKPPSDNTVKPLLILDSDMKKMFNQLYEEILNNNLQGK